MKIQQKHSFQTIALVLAAVLMGSFFARADSLELLWNLEPDQDRGYLATDNAQRGLAYNSANGHVLIVSRTGGANVYVLDGDTGADLNALIMDTVSGGIYPINMIGVADDGVVYAGNLSVSLTTVYFKLYRWENDNWDTFPTVAFEGDPAGIDELTLQSKNPQRWGDSIDVRGSGVDTMVVIASRASSAVAIFTTTNGIDFTSTIVTDVANNAGSLGVAFGEGNSVWSKIGNQPLRHASFDLATGQGGVLHSFDGAVFPAAIGPIGVDVANKQLGGITIETPDNFRLYDLTDLAAGPILIDRVDLPTDNPNINNVGAVDFGPDRVYVLDSNNGVQAYKIVRAVLPEPPTIDTQPQGQSVLQGGPVTFSVAVKGTVPFSYQWRFDGTDIAGATESTYTIDDAQPAHEGNYSVVISNEAGSVTSEDAALTVIPTVQTDALSLLWTLSPGDRAYIATDNAQRGLAYNAASNHVLVVSRTGGNNIYVMDGDTGAHLHAMNVDPTIVFGGTFALNMIGVAEDGVVYACNLTTSGSGFTIYRWENDSPDAFPTIAFGPGDPGLGRCGDTIDVRGSGVGTQILIASRNGTTVAVLTTLDGWFYYPTVIDVPDASNGDFGLGVTFGAGDTFWGKSSSRALQHVGYDLMTYQGTVLHKFDADNFPSLMNPISVEPNKNWLAAIALEQPDNVRLYDISNLDAVPVLLDQESFPTDNPNANGTGALDFGNGRLYALDSNNGIMAFAVQKPTPQPTAPVLSAPKLVSAQEFQLTLTGEVSRTYVIEASTDLKTWTPVATNTASAATIDISVTVSGDLSFYRAAVKP